MKTLPVFGISYVLLHKVSGNFTSLLLLKTIYQERLYSSVFNRLISSSTICRANL
ncbi:Hypothetical protein FNO222_0834 [Francisella orientalis]|uniref:Uncharacterized protein n=1 Tax=Francisella orientalis TaxID=299583 RepID=A0ABM5U5P7_9GAMM|nr:hypothetical protein FNO12_0830 [Francisella orientalis FNO12]AKN87051.1 Hypothetical protein FNO24_0830 [Francisella orientalis FNO24]AKN88589.1 Hypothetical protein FNO190_0830 [Francisella orientalis]AKU05345.1 Hypothetical protein FNO01_0830 [Francisella orientalis]QEN20255.1 Hypothetical protein FNO39_0834 [Francisella orientalis]